MTDEKLFTKKELQAFGEFARDESRTQSDERNSSRQSPMDFGTLEKVKEKITKLINLYKNKSQGNAQKVEDIIYNLKELLSQLEDDEVKK